MFRDKKFDAVPFVLGILFFIITIIFLTTGIHKQKEYKIVKNDIIEIPAMVTKITVSKDSDSIDNYSALVTYYYDGEEYENRTWKSSSDKNKYRIGQEVTIRINPHDPTSVYNYDGNFGIWIFFTVFFFAIGLGLIVLSFKVVKW